MHELWTERYRPKTIADCVLPEGVKAFLQKQVDSPEPPMNMLFHGGPGIGKTTALKALAAQKDCDLFFINMSLKGNIDTLRTDIQQFASTRSLSSGGKIVGGDEFDYSNQQSTQPALRGMIEEFTSCRFIFTCNYPKRIIEPLRGRLNEVDFTIPPEEKAPLAEEFMVRLGDILTREGCEYNRKALASLIIDRFPNFRRMVNDAQRLYNTVGRVDGSVDLGSTSVEFSELIGYMKSRKYGDVRRWVGRHSDVDPNVFFRMFYDEACELVAKKSIPQMVLTLSEYQFKAAHVADQEINTAACFAELMHDMEWK